MIVIMIEIVIAIAFVIVIVIAIREAIIENCMKYLTLKKYELRDMIQYHYSFL